MDKLDTPNNLVRRRYCYYDTFGYYHCRSSAWGNWGRWILVGVLVLLFLAFLFCTCLVSRRRRAKGGKPIYGTGWMPGVGGPQANNNNYQPPPPQYGVPQQDNYGYNNRPGQESGYAPPPPQAPKPAYNAQGGFDMPQYNSNNTADAGANSSYYNPPAGPPPAQYK